MPDVEIDDIASVGSVRDTPSYQLPPEVWTSAMNMRAIDDGMEGLLGWSQVFDPPTVPPYFLLPVSTTSTEFWLYMGLNKAYVYDGAVHTNITRQTASVDVNYNATDATQFNGTFLGGIPIINNGVDTPQFWSPPTIATKLQNLTNWTVGSTARIIRSFGPFLMAFGLTDAVGGAKPHLLRWSHPADPGSVPVTWNVADETHDAGEVDLSDTQSGVILDALPLSDQMYVYKGSSIWKVRFVGGNSIMDIGKGPWLSNIGLLTSRCVALTGDGLRHVVVTQDDVVWHNGNQVKSILNRRQRRRLFNEMDSVNFTQTFLYSNALSGEMHLCYPGPGSTFADRSLILNYREADDWVVTEGDGITYVAAATGGIEVPSVEQWNDGTDDWNTDTGPWSELARRRTIVADPTRSHFYNLDSGTKRDTTVFTCTLSREGLALLGKKRNGDWIVDHQIMKMFRNLRPKIQGGPISVRIGFQMQVNGPITWSVAQLFASGDINFNPAPVSGRAIAVEFSAPSTSPFRLDGYKVDVEQMGEF